MNLPQSLRPALLLIFTSLLLHDTDAPAGWPVKPNRNPPGRRQANMLMLRFQDALAENRWPEALSFCSDRVRAKSAAWPSLKEFFNDTMPVESVLAQDFGCWSCGDTFYGLFVPLYGFEKHASKVNANANMQWYWGIVSTNGGWVIDYPPVKMDDYIAQRRAAIQERDDRIAALRRELEPKAKHLTTRLTALTNRFALGAPMPFRVELVNAGPTPVHYSDSGVRFKGLTILDVKQQPVSNGNPPMQIMVNRGEAPAGATVILAESLDINKYGAIAKPGKYTVQFASADLQLGQPGPLEQPGRFGENLGWANSSFTSATNTFPSNSIEIEVLP